MVKSCKRCGRGLRSKHEFCEECQDVRNGVPEVNRKTFYDRRRKWKQECVDEMNDGSGNIFDGVSLEDIEICDNGQVRLKKSFVITGSNYVTPWRESEYYCVPK